MHQPGIEPGAPAWQAEILPLNHWYVYVNGRKLKILSLRYWINEVKYEGLLDYNDQWIIIEQDKWSCGIEQGTQNTTDLSYIQLNLHHRKYYTQVCM